MKNWISFFGSLFSFVFLLVFYGSITISGPLGIIAVLMIEDLFGDSEMSEKEEKEMKLYGYESYRDYLKYEKGIG